LKTSKIRKSARGKMCSLQIYPYCNNNTETTVLAHLPSMAKGMSIKSPDYLAVYACSSCHDLIDGRMHVTNISKEELLRCQMRGLERTWGQLITEGLITIT